MINLHLSLTNPWYKENFKNLFNRFGVISKHKTWEFEVCRYARDVLSIHLQWTVHEDHAGPSVELCLLGYSMSFRIYDNRHWNHEECRYYVYTEEGGFH